MWMVHVRIYVIKTHDSESGQEEIGNTRRMSELLQVAHL